MKIKVFEAFAGYGSQAMALNRLRENYPQFDYEVGGISEIDKYALQAYQAVHGHCSNYGDISKIDWNTVPDFDLLTYSFPCTDISKAGQQKGLSKASGTRSSLLWECQRAIEIKRPKYLLMENVSDLLSEKFLPDFKEWRNILGELGYSSFTQILNATQFGVPQNRQRVFMVSILGDCQYHFPAPFKLTKRLKDMLEPVVDEKYYLSDKVIASLNAHRERIQERGNGFGWQPTTGEGIAKAIYCWNRYQLTPTKMAMEINATTICLNSKVDGKQPSLQDRVYDCNGVSPAITTCFLPNIAEPRVIQVGNIYPDTETFHNRTMGRVYSAEGLSPTINCCGGGDRVPKVLILPLLIPEATTKGYAEAYDGDSVNLALPNSKTRRGRVGHQIANTLDTSCNQGVVVKEQFNTIIGNKQQNPHRGSVSGVAPCITSACGAGGGMTPMLTDADLETTKTTDFIEQLRGHQELRYRIRKLTPRECFRLMDVSEPDIDKLLNAGISNSQLYKLAGNSIVVSCLYHIFRKIFIEPQNENQQLTLF